MKRSPLRRKSPLKASKPMRRAKPSVSAAQRKQREAVKERSDLRCEFLLVNHVGSFRCVAFGVKMAHAPWPRRTCGKARYLPEVVLWACRECRDVFDGRNVRAIPWFRREVPIECSRAAYDAILAASKDRASTLAALGKRP